MSLIKILPRNLLGYLVLICVAISICVGQQKLAPEKQSQIEAEVAKFMETTHTPGLSVAVVENGELEWSRGFGLADVENTVPASAPTLFRLASISKPLTAVGAMQLVEQHKLDLDAPVQKYCPAFPQRSATITTRQVMGHLAGIRHYKSDSPEDPEVGNTRHFADPIQGGLDFFKNDPLLSEPGKQFHYSTHGYTLVGCVIEGASGEKYVDFMRQHVLLPAGMEHTVADDRYVIIPYRTRFYEKTKDGTVRNADFLDSSYKIPGGGWLSSVDDMAKFEVAILSDKLLKSATRELMWTPLKTVDGKTNGYALGWGTFHEDGTLFVEHSGGQQGTSTDFVIAPARRAGVVVLSNLEEAPTPTLAKGLIRILLAPSKP